MSPSRQYGRVVENYLCSLSEMAPRNFFLMSTAPPLAAEYPKVGGTGGHSSVSLHNGAPEHGLLGILPRLRPLPRSRAMGRAFVRSVFRLQLAQRSIWPWSRDLHAQAPEPVIPHALPLPCKDASRSAAFVELLATSIQSSFRAMMCPSSLNTTAHRCTCSFPYGKYTIANFSFPHAAPFNGK